MEWGWFELSSDKFREHNLNRFVDSKKIIRAFKILKKNKINTTAYQYYWFARAIRGLNYRYN